MATKDQDKKLTGINYIYQYTKSIPVILKTEDV